MGKSPGKWIKTILFGKKASRSNSSKGRYASRATNEKETWVAAKEPTADLPVDHPSVSEPTPGTSDRNGGNSVLEQGIASNCPRDEAVMFPRNLDSDKQGTTGSSAPADPEINRLEQAATKAQAAFRGYLARRAFRALRGIIRLQALVRGHLVRRQAVATLRCLQGIVKFQALVRGRRVRFSDAGREVHKKCTLRKPLDGKRSVSVEVHKFTRAEKLSANTFVSKLLRSSPVAMPLRLQYGLEEPDSAWNWLERWTSSRFWEPLPQPKKVVHPKTQTGQSNFRSAETEPGRSKRTFRKVPPAYVDNGSMHSTPETEKPKRNLRKPSSHPVDPVQEHAQNELEKVKRNLRKVSNSTAEHPDQQEVETEKPKRSLKKASSSAADTLDRGICESAEKLKKDLTVGVSQEPDVETTLKSLEADKTVDLSHDNQPPLESLPLEESIGKDKNITVTNGESISKEDQTSRENQKSSRRRASYPAKQENPENGLQNSPTLPSYMAATESAKAKLRGQGSPKFGQDETEKNGFTRRHSLPSSINGKLSSLSPRAQRLVQPSGKGVKNDKSLLSSRDGSEKVVQAEWRR